MKYDVGTIVVDSWNSRRFGKIVVVDDDDPKLPYLVEWDPHHYVWMEEDWLDEPPCEIPL